MDSNFIFILPHSVHSHNIIFSHSYSFTLKDESRFDTHQIGENLSVIDSQNFNTLTLALF